MSGARRIGSEEEDLAATALLEKGYVLLGRRVKTRSGELDIVALDNETLVIVEVKRRMGSAPEESITPTKIDRLQKAATEFVEKMDLANRQIRFDLVVFDHEGMRHYEDGIRI